VSYLVVCCDVGGCTVGGIEAREAQLGFDACFEELHLLTLPVYEHHVCGLDLL
jgi:hypothetical protein